MKCENKTLLLYAVTDRCGITKDELIKRTELAIKGGVTIVQLREKELSDSEFLAEAIEIKKVCDKFNVPLIINDNVDVAIRCGAHGVHVGQSDMKAGKVREKVGENLILGVSVQTSQQAIEAQASGADYLGVGAVFATSTKPDADSVRLDTLKDICQSVDIPVVAIGGINKENMAMLSGTGIAGVALVSAIYGAEDTEKECEKLLKLSKEAVEAQ